MTDTLQTAELEQQAIEILDDYLDGGEYHEYTPLEKKRHAAHVLDLINSEVTKKLEAVLAVLPEKIEPLVQGQHIISDTHNAVIDQVTTAITNLVAGSGASSRINPSVRTTLNTEGKLSA